MLTALEAATDTDACNRFERIAAEAYEVLRALQVRTASHICWGKGGMQPD